MRFAFLALALVSQISIAKTITCRHHVQDSSTIVRFDAVGDDVEVKLLVPAGETAGNWMTGRCKFDARTDVTSFTCNLFTSSDSGYDIRLYSYDYANLHATVQRWTRSGKGPLQRLTCDKQ